MKNKNYIIFELTRNPNYSYGVAGGSAFYWKDRKMTRERLIRYLADSYRWTYPVLDHLSEDMTETSCEYCFEYGYHRIYIPVYFIAKIKSGNIIKVDRSSIENEVKEKKRELDIRREKSQKCYDWSRKMDNSYEFRRDPVPNVHKRHHHRGSYFRCCKIHGKAVTEAMMRTEYPELVDPYYRKFNLPTFDDRPRHLDKSWKTSYKVRKQWMKHLDPHKDTKRISKKEVVDLIRKLEDEDNC